MTVRLVAPFSPNEIEKFWIPGDGGEDVRVAALIEWGGHPVPNHVDGAVGAPPVVHLAGYEFTFMAPLNPERDAMGVIRELRPQALYAKRDTVALHYHGSGPFCKFRIDVPARLAGVYALVVDGSIRYIGECEDLAKRFNMGYGTISPRNCYRGGQATNCKINHHVLDMSTSGGRVNLYFHPTLMRHQVEKQLIARYSPPWND